MVCCVKFDFITATGHPFPCSMRASPDCVLVLFFGVAAVFILFQPPERADETTKLKFEQPIELPHLVLPVRSYRFISGQFSLRLQDRGGLQQ